MCIVVAHQKLLNARDRASRCIDGVRRCIDQVHHGQGANAAGWRGADCFRVSRGSGPPTGTLPSG